MSHFQIDAVSKAFKDYFACMNYVDVKESEKFEQAHKFIMDHGGWNFSGPTWSSDNWELMPNLVKIHRLQFFPLFKTYVWEDIKNSTRNQLVVSSILMFSISNELQRLCSPIDDAD